MSGRLGVFIKTLTRCVCLSRARGRNQRPVNNLHNASETDISFSNWLLHTFWLQLLAFAILTTLCPPSAAYPAWAIKTLHKLGSAKLLQTNTQSNRIAKIFALSERYLNEGVTLSCLLYFLKQQTFVQEKTTSMQLFSLIVSFTITVVIASGRCPSKSLKIGKPGKLIDSLLFHTFTLQCSLPFPPLGHPWHQENGGSFSKRSIQLEWRNCKWYL